MKAWILLLLVLLGLVVSSVPGAGSLQITIVIPAAWGPYIEWLMDFPGCQPVMEGDPGGIFGRPMRLPPVMVVELPRIWVGRIHEMRRMVTAVKVVPLQEVVPVGK